MLEHSVSGRCLTDQNARYFLPGSPGDPKDDFDQEVIKRMERFGFPKDIIVFCLLQRKKNSLTTAYYLLKEAIIKEVMKEGERSEIKRSALVATPATSTL